MGMSHYFLAWATVTDEVYDSRAIDTYQPLNAPTVAWCQNMFAHLHTRGYELVWSTSFEMLDSYMPEDWKQRDYQDNIGLSGWVPPSAFFIPVMPECLDYLSNVIKQGMGLAQAAGLDLKFQIGEPWWWDGSYSGGSPCIYGGYVKNKYFTETGQYAQTPYIQSYLEPVTELHRPYLEWLGAKLGEATATIRDAVKAEYPTAQATLLFFTPQILSPVSEMLPIINFPVTDWEYPNYDFVQIEDYDWIISGDFDLVATTPSAALDTLGYPVETVHYLVGFVLNEEDGEIWDNMGTALDIVRGTGIRSLSVWAYPQVIRDNIVVGLV
jgi:hypothetical protein